MPPSTQAAGSEPGKAPSIGRGEKVRTAVLAATVAELAESGYAALTVEAVAQRAGVHKTTVYRRWRDRETLVVDALTGHAAAETPIPDTGTIETDLRELARTLVGRLNAAADGGAGLGVLTSDASRIPEIAQVKRDFFADRVRHAEPLIRRAVRRGELPGDTDPAEFVKAMLAPILLRVLITAEPVDETTADRAALTALAAARAGLCTAHAVP
jgi:AcrR family transcriptional regulator